MNKFTKRTLIQTVLAEYWLVSKHPDWSEVLGSIVSAINMQHGWEKYDVSAYEAVYGQKMDHEFSCSKEEARQCWTVQDQLKVVKFNENGCENYILDDAEIADNDANGFFSDGLLPSDKKDSVG
jgi:hypothetical protein